MADVTAVDQNELALEILQSIVAREDLEMPVGLYDINAAALHPKLWFHRIDCGPHVFRRWSSSSDYPQYAEHTKV